MMPIILAVFFVFLLLVLFVGGLLHSAKIGDEAIDQTVCKELDDDPTFDPPYWAQDCPHIRVRAVHNGWSKCLDCVEEFEW